MEDVIFSPLKGRAIKITEVNDQMFSQKMLGDGVAIYPDYKTTLFAKHGFLYAPCDCEVIMVFTEKHAIGFKTMLGNEILIHMGIDTVELEGAPFTISCRVGDKVKQGEKIGEIDWKMIAKAGKDTVVPIICTSNIAEATVNIITDQGQVCENSELFSIK